MLNLGGVQQSLRAIQCHFWEGRSEISDMLVEPSIGKAAYKDPTVIEAKKARYEDIWIEDENGSIKTKAKALTRDTCEARNWVNRHILGRLSALQIVTIMVDTVGTQLIRGIGLSLLGCLTFEKKVVLRGLKDLAAASVQFVALPLIALATLATPRGAAYLAAQMIKHLDQSYFNPQCWPTHLNGSDFSNKVSKVIVGATLGIVAIPLSCVRPLLAIPVGLLQADGSGLLNVIAAIVCMVAEPIASIGSLFTAKSYSDLANEVYDANFDVFNRVFYRFFRNFGGGHGEKAGINLFSPHLQFVPAGK